MLTKVKYTFGIGIVMLLLLVSMMSVSAQTYCDSQNQNDLVFCDDFEQNNTNKWTPIGSLASIPLVQNELALGGNVSVDINTGSFSNKGGILANLTNQSIVDGIVNMTFYWKPENPFVLQGNWNFMLTNSSDGASFVSGVSISGDDAGNIRIQNTSTTIFNFDTWVPNGFYNMTLLVDLDNNLARAIVDDGSIVDSGWIGIDPIDQIKYIRIMDFTGGDRIDGKIDNIKVYHTPNVQTFCDLQTGALFCDDFEQNNTDNWQVLNLGTLTLGGAVISDNISAVFDTGSPSDKGGAYVNLTSLNLINGTLNLTAKWRGLLNTNTNNYFVFGNDTSINNYGKVGVVFPDDANVYTVGDTNSLIGTWIIFEYGINILLNMDNKSFKVSYFKAGFPNTLITSEWSSFDLDQVKYFSVQDIAAGDRLKSVFDDVLILYTSPPPPPPSEFNLLLPANETIFSNNGTVEFDWENATDITFDELNYTLYVFNKTNNILVKSLNVTQSNATLTLPLDDFYLWNVTVTNGISTNKSVQTFQFGFQLNPVISSQVCDSLVFPNEENLPKAAEISINFSVFSMIGFNNPVSTVNLTIGSSIFSSQNCNSVALDANNSNYNCSFAMDYYNLPGSYDLYVKVENDGRIGTVSQASICSYGQLVASRRVENNMGFSNAGPGIVNSMSDTGITMFNTGNVNLTLDLKAYDLPGKSSPGILLSADSFKAGMTLGTSVQLQDSVVKALAVSILPGLSSSEVFNLWLSMPSNQLIQDYVTQTPWEVTAIQEI